MVESVVLTDVSKLDEEDQPGSFSLDTDPAAWNLDFPVLCMLPVDPFTFKIKGKWKSVANSTRFPGNYSLPIDPVGTASLKGAQQESYFHQLMMLKKLMAVNLALLDHFSDDLVAFSKLKDDAQCPRELLHAQLLLTHQAQLSDYFSTVSKKRKESQVSYLSGAKFKFPKDDPKVVEEPLELAKGINKVKKLVKESKSLNKPYPGVSKPSNQNHYRNNSRSSNRDSNGRFSRRPRYSNQDSRNSREDSNSSHQSAPKRGGKH